MICYGDFNSDDFNDDDFRTTSWAKRINDFLFYIFPDYFKQNDSYKDNNNRGLLERFISLFGDEIDEHVVPYIECIMDSMDSSTSNPKFYPHIADSFGMDTTLFLSNDIYKNVLSTCLSFYKKKSTLEYITRYFYILGYDITITKEPISTEHFYWDLSVSDNSGRWDELQCPICFKYSAAIYKLPSGGSITVDEENKLKDILISQAPINSSLTNFTVTI